MPAPAHTIAERANVMIMPMLQFEQKVSSIVRLKYFICGMKFFNRRLEPNATLYLETNGGLSSHRREHHNDYRRIRWNALTPVPCLKIQCLGLILLLITHARRS
jgi:hypothetical protein